MYSRVFLILFLSTISLTLFGQITITTNKADAIYNVGENINFVVRSNQSGNATYTIRYDKDSNIESGTVYLQAGVDKNISYTSSEPNLINCVINQNGQGGSATAAVSPFNIQPLEPIPNNFDSFWSGQKSQLAAIPLQPNIYLHSSSLYSKTYRIRLSQIDNRKVYGYVTVPNGNGNYPAFLVMPSFGTAPNTIQPEITLAEQTNVITIAISIHNADVNQEDANAYQPDNYVDPAQNYFRYAILAGVRAIDYLHTRSDVDKSKIGVYGVSQGGGLAILMAGIDDRIKVCMNTISILCEHAGFKYGRASGFPYYLKNAPGYNYPQEQTLSAIKYYDAVHAASRFKGPVHMNISYLDDVTPASTEFAAYNQFTGDHKVLVHSPKLGHSSPSRFWEDRVKFLRRLWPNATANPPWPYTDNSKGHWVDAGNDISAQAGTPVNLSGTVQYNNSTNYSWPVTWEKVSGPGSVVFSSPNNRNTSTTFSSSGTYLLRFRAEDKQTYSNNNLYMTMEDFVQVTVGGNGTIQQSQTISFADISDKLTTDSPFSISATASSGLTVSFGIVSGPATISNNQITLIGQAGTVTVRASQLGNASYYPAPEVTQSFQVNSPTNGGGGSATCSNLSLLSQGKSTQSASTLFVSGVSGSPSKAVDGNTNGSFWNGSVAACTNSYQPWWEVDLGSIHNIEQIKVWNRTEGTDRLENFYVILSDTPLSTNLNSAISASTWNQYTSNSAGTPTTYSLNATGRYVRIQANSNSYLTIAEVQVYGCSDGGGNEGGGGTPGTPGCDDFDNDGVCNEVDCNIWNPNLPATPGTPCDDYDPHNFNDVYLADGCTCQGSDSSSGGGSGGGGTPGCDDFDNDGVCNADDCNIWNPNLPATPGTPCDDYDPHNFNDVYLADGCTCQGSDSSSGSGDGSGGGGDGTTTEYCESKGTSTAYEYIQKVIIGSIDNNSGNNNGYANYEYLTANGSIGDGLYIRLTPGFTGSSQFVYWRVWIDFNQDGDFYDSGEYFFQRKSKTVVTNSPSIPVGALTGNTKMRVSMKAGAYADPCETFPYGEVEDYIINISQSSAPRISHHNSTNEKFDFILRPNPVDDVIISEFVNKISSKNLTNIYIHNTLGEKFNLESLDYRIEEDRIVIFTSSLKAGYYLLSIVYGDEFITKPFVKIE